MQNNVYFEKPQISGSRVITMYLALIVFYIIFAAVMALPMKYIFLDYFVRMNYIHNYSYLTVVMALLASKFVLSFLRFNIKIFNTATKS